MITDDMIFSTGYGLGTDGRIHRTGWDRMGQDRMGQDRMGITGHEHITAPPSTAQNRIPAYKCKCKCKSLFFPASTRLQLASGVDYLVPFAATYHC